MPMPKLMSFLHGPGCVVHTIIWVAIIISVCVNNLLFHGWCTYSVFGTFFIFLAFVSIICICFSFRAERVKVHVAYVCNNFLCFISHVHVLYQTLVKARRAGHEAQVEIVVWMWSICVLLFRGLCQSEILTRISDVLIGSLATLTSCLSLFSRSASVRTVSVLRCVHAACLSLRWHSNKSSAHPVSVLIITDCVCLLYLVWQVC